LVSEYDGKQNLSDLRAIFGFDTGDVFPNKKLCNLFIITMIIKPNGLT
jgi:hypothetical protein